jgi:hypothetical protein
MKMKFMFPAWGSKVIDFIYEFEQINGRVGLNILMILVLIEVERLFLLNNAKYNILKVVPTFPDINFGEFLHASHKLQISNKILNAKVISSQCI